jgi:hypothetical protein
MKKREEKQAYKIGDTAKLQYARYCQQVRDFFKTPKGKELKAVSDQTAKDLSLAMQSGPAAIKAMQEAQKSWPDDDCFCEAGIIFYDKGKRYKVGRCDSCRLPEKPEHMGNVQNWRD